MLSTKIFKVSEISLYIMNPGYERKESYNGNCEKKYVILNYVIVFQFYIFYTDLFIKK